jgi:hypothetical protein
MSIVFNAKAQREQKITKEIGAQGGPSRSKAHFKVSRNFKRSFPAWQVRKPRPMVAALQGVVD